MNHPLMQCIESVDVSWTPLLKKRQSRREERGLLIPKILMSLALGVATVGTASAHFQMILPSADMVTSPAERHLKLDIKFWHPFEGHGMDIEAPVQFGVRADGKNVDLRTTLKPRQFTDVTGKKRNGFQAIYDIKRPGDYVFYVEPKPFWEDAEETFIVHYTKVVVNGFGLQQGWDNELGFKTEIVPLARPYGLYTGNVFQGIVKLNGRPAPFSEVEVEYYNESGKHKAPADPMITQVIKADANGVFTYAMPKAGWWGFAALHVDTKKMKKDGKDYPVEIGAVIWIKTRDMQ